MSALRISVVIPTCERTDLLALCLGRLAPGAQSLPASEYEVIVTDDGASGSAASLVHDRFPWATWCAGPGRGPAANRNHGMSKAHGMWLAFTDDDCLPGPDWLAAFAAATAAFPEDRVFEGKTTCSSGPPRSPLEDAPINLTGGWLWSCNFLIARGTYEAVGGFDETYPIAFMEDADLRERLLRRGLRYPFVPGAVVDHPLKRYSLRTNVERYAESEAIFWLRHRDPAGLSGSFLAYMIKSRLGSLRRGDGGCPPRDRLVAARLVARELWFAVTRLRRWEAAHRVGRRNSARDYPVTGVPQPTSRPE